MAERDPTTVLHSVEQRQPVRAADDRPRLVDRTKAAEEERATPRWGLSKAESGLSQFSPDPESLDYVHRPVDPAAGVAAGGAPDVFPVASRQFARQPIDARDEMLVVDQCPRPVPDVPKIAQKTTDISLAE